MVATVADLSPYARPVNARVVATVAAVANRTVTASEVLRILAPSAECLTYRYSVAVLRLIDRWANPSSYGGVRCCPRGCT